MLHRDIKKMEAREKYNFHWKRINKSSLYVKIHY